MKLVTTALLAVGLAATTAFSADLRYVVTESRAEYNTLQWVGQYYKNPQPELMFRRVNILSEMGYFQEKANVSQSVGFFARIFADNPEKVDSWFAHFKTLPTSEQQILAGALWLSGNEKADQFVQHAGFRNGNEAVASLLGTQARTLNDLIVDSESAMNAQWGAFIASGDARHVTSILAAVGSGTPELTDSARFSLALKAAQDDRVMEICQAELTKQPKAVQEVVRAAMNATPASTPSS